MLSKRRGEASGRMRASGEDFPMIRAANVPLPSPPFWGERGWG